MPRGSLLCGLVAGVGFPWAKGEKRDDAEGHARASLVPEPRRLEGQLRGSPSQEKSPARAGLLVIGARTVGGSPRALSSKPKQCPNYDGAALPRSGRNCLSSSRVVSVSGALRHSDSP
jgi:hypothetical protein